CVLGILGMTKNPPAGAHHQRTMPPHQHFELFFLMMGGVAFEQLPVGEVPGSPLLDQAAKIHQHAMPGSQAHEKSPSAKCASPIMPRFRGGPPTFFGFFADRKSIVGCVKRSADAPAPRGAGASALRLTHPTCSCSFGVRRGARARAGARN